MSQLIILSIIALGILIFQNIQLRRSALKPWLFWISFFGCFGLLIFIWFIDANTVFQNRILYTILILVFMIQNFWFFTREKVKK